MGSYLRKATYPAALLRRERVWALEPQETGPVLFSDSACTAAFLLHADLFSHHTCPLRDCFLLWWSPKELPQ